MSNSLGITRYQPFREWENDHDTIKSCLNELVVFFQFLNRSKMLSTQLWPNWMRQQHAIKHSSINTFTPTSIIDNANKNEMHWCYHFIYSFFLDCNSIHLTHCWYHMIKWIWQHRLILLMYAILESKIYPRSDCTDNNIILMTTLR